MSAWASFRGWLFAPGDPRTAAALRIGFCIACLLSLWDLWPSLDLLLGRAGAYGTLDPLNFEPSPIFGLLFFHDSPAEIRVWYWLAVAATCLAAVGLGSRVTFVLAYVLMILGHERNPYALSAADSVLRQLGLWIMCLDTSAAWSVDAAIRRFRKGSPRLEVAGWPLRAILLQVAAIYWTSLFFKLQTAEWREGTALFVHGLTYVTLLCELMIPPLLLMKPIHRWGIALGASLHVGMDLFMNLRGFAPAMCVGFLAAAEHADWEAVARLRPWWRRTG